MIPTLKKNATTTKITQQHQQLLRLLNSINDGTKIYFNIKTKENQRVLLFQ